MPLGIGERRRLHQQRLEADEHLPRQDLEPSLGFVARIDSVDRIGDALDASEAVGADQGHGVEPEVAQMRLGLLDGLQQRLDPFFDRRDDFLPTLGVVAEGVLGQSLAQALQHTVVVDDQPEILTRETTIGPGDGLHQGVRLHRLVDVKRRQALHIEARQPHGADDGDAEGMFRALEGGLHVHALAVGRFEPLLHQGAMGDDVETPFLEVGDLVLRLADDDPDNGVFEPLRLRGQLLVVGLEPFPRLRIDGRHQLGLLRFRCGANRLGFSLPWRNDPLMHAGASDLVDADQHRLPGLPPGRAMLDEVVGDLVQPIVGRDHLVVPAQQLFEQRRLVGVEFGLLDLGGDAVVEVQPGNAELLAPVLVDELHRRSVLLGALEVVSGDIVSENPLCDRVVLEQGRSGEADKGRIGQREAHVARQPSRLRPVGLVGNHDDVVPFAVRLRGVHILVELVNQTEDVGVVLLQQLLELHTGGRTGGLVVGNAAADEGLVKLVVQIDAVRHQHEGEVAGHGAPDFLGEERHRVGFAAALSVPKHTEFAEIGMRPLDDLHRTVRHERRGGLGQTRHPRALDRRPRFQRQFDHAMTKPRTRRELLFQFLLPDHRIDGTVDAEDLMVASDDLACGSGLALVEQNEVFDDVE